MNEVFGSGERVSLMALSRAYGAAAAVVNLKPGLTMMQTRRIFPVDGYAP